MQGLTSVIASTKNLTFTSCTKNLTMRLSAGPYRTSSDPLASFVASDRSVDPIASAQSRLNHVNRDAEMGTHVCRIRRAATRTVRIVTAGVVLVGCF